jgi:hypothetical protein
VEFGHARKEPALLRNDARHDQEQNAATTGAQRHRPASPGAGGASLLDNLNALPDARSDFWDSARRRASPGCGAIKATAPKPGTCLRPSTAASPKASTPPRTNKEFAILSRSMLEILLEVGSGIDVPTAHVSKGRTSSSGRREDAENPRDRPLIRILSSQTQPDDSFSAVHYRGSWYWISDDDLASKRVFTFLMMFFSLAETGVTPQAPVLTIPAS